VVAVGAGGGGGQAIYTTDATTASRRAAVECTGRVILRARLVVRRPETDLDCQRKENIDLVFIFVTP